MSFKTLNSQSIHKIIINIKNKFYIITNPNRSEINFYTYYSGLPLFLKKSISFNTYVSIDYKINKHIVTTKFNMIYNNLYKHNHQNIKIETFLDNKIENLNNFAEIFLTKNGISILGGVIVGILGGIIEGTIDFIEESSRKYYSPNSDTGLLLLIIINTIKWSILGTVLTPMVIGSIYLLLFSSKYILRFFINSIYEDLLNPLFHKLFIHKQLLFLFLLLSTISFSINKSIFLLTSYLLSFSIYYNKGLYYEGYNFISDLIISGFLTSGLFSIEIIARKTLISGLFKTYFLISKAPYYSIFLIAIYVIITIIR